MEKVKFQLEKGNKEPGEQTVASQVADTTVTVSQDQDGNELIRFCLLCHGAISEIKDSISALIGTPGKQ